MAFDVYAAFREKIENQILEYLPPEYENAKIQIAPVQKNNGVTLYGLSILKPEEKICPTIYLEKYFNEFAEVLHLADSVFIAPVFAAWSETGSVNAADLAAAAGGIAAVGTFREQAETVKADLPEGKNVIAVLGAGDVNKVIEFL